MAKKPTVLIILIIQGILLLWFCCCNRGAQSPHLLPVTDGWAANSINTVIFRRNSIVSDGQFQYVAFYDDSARMVLAKRALGSDKWQLYKTQYKGTITDAHNSISLMLDGNGYLHIAWDHHDSPLRYCRSDNPGSLSLTEEMPMTEQLEDNVTYPEFYRLPSGDLLFLYRDGGSGHGNLVMNRYDVKFGGWMRLHDNLIDGENERNTYWQMVIASEGTIHLSWVWRESWDVVSNHDICYAKSTDGGLSWQKSNGELYKLPITVESAEYAAIINQGNELINQTSMCTDTAGHPLIAGYWAPNGSDIPQFHIVWHDGNRWIVKQITKRKIAFALNGGGTKRIPVSRPQILVDKLNTVYLIYRDSERGNLVTVASCNDLVKNVWYHLELTRFSVGQWEPTYDTELWKSNNLLHLFVQKVGQGNAEELDDLTAQMIFVLEYAPVY